MGGLNDDSADDPWVFDFYHRLDTFTFNFNFCDFLILLAF